MLKEIIRFVVTASVVLLACFLLVRHQSTRFAFVDMTKVYADFKLTKDLDKKLKETNQARQNILDSLSISLKMIESELKAGKKDAQLLSNYNMKREELMMRQEQFSKDFEQQSQEYNSQILKQINEKIEEYRTDKGLDIVIGANGNGFIMAGNTALDCTTGFIEFINKK
ncbi:MAG: OmpH family outer membrane protein [Bacteroidetes bacterium]|nr:OmpH family outer membrane protein [Bacteroidota bacterium]